VDLFCGFFMEESAPGFTLSVRSLTALAARGIEAGFCIYGPTEKAT
jgi:hypothetical protein